MKVLVPTDGSGSLELAARSILEPPWPTGTEVRVLSAVELILPATRGLLQPPFVNSVFIESAQAEAMKRAQGAIAQAGQFLSAIYLNVSESISVLLEPAKTIIVDEAAEWRAAIVVLGSHGRHGVDRFSQAAYPRRSPCAPVVRWKLSGKPDSKRAHWNIRFRSNI
jgi:nucleotide-binding universal stress UspA family protein